MIPPPYPDSQFPFATTAGTHTATTASYGFTISYGFWPSENDCPVCRARPGNSRHSLSLCFPCAEMQRWLPRRMRYNLEALREALAELEAILKRARSYFHPPSRIWRQIASQPPLPALKPRPPLRLHRHQVRLAPMPSRRAARAIRASHVPGHRRRGGRRKAV